MNLDGSAPAMSGQSMHSVDAARPASKSKCRFGRKCWRPGCWHSHPNGFKIANHGNRCFFWEFNGKCKDQKCASNHGHNNNLHDPDASCNEQKIWKVDTLLRRDITAVKKCVEQLESDKLAREKLQAAEFAKFVLTTENWKNETLAFLQHNQQQLAHAMQRAAGVAAQDAVHDSEFVAEESKFADVAATAAAERVAARVATIFFAAREKAEAAAEIEKASEDAKAAEVADGMAAEEMAAAEKVAAEKSAAGAAVKKAAAEAAAKTETAAAEKAAAEKVLPMKQLSKKLPLMKEQLAAQAAARKERAAVEKAAARAEVGETKKASEAKVEKDTEESARVRRRKRVACRSCGKTGYGGSHEGKDVMWSTCCSNTDVRYCCDFCDCKSYVCCCEHCYCKREPFLDVLTKKRPAGLYNRLNTYMLP